MHRFPTIAIIGVGEMGEAIVHFALEGGWPRDRLILTHHRAERRAELEDRYGGTVTSENAASARNSKVVLVSVRPQQFAGVLEQLRPALCTEHLLISVAAALDIPWLERRLLEGIGIVRAGPPPASRVKAGLAFLTANQAATAAQREVAKQLFAPMCRRILWMPDELIDAVSAIGPGITPFSSLMVKTLIEVGIEQGVPADLAREVAYEGLLAAGQLILGGGFEPDELLSTIATHEGLAQAALRTMEEYGVPEGIRAGALAMLARSMDLRGDPVPPEMQDFER
jgi:pyrroline-5-carboxylate reductase